MPKIIRSILSLIAYFLCFGSMQTFGYQHYAFKQIGSDEGLSSSYVKAIAQDANGFIWFGTKNGLDRFDGISVRTFYCRDEKAERGNNNIGAIYEDDDHNLWIGTDRGVYIFNYHTEEFSMLDIVSANGVMVEDWIQTIQGDKSGNIRKDRILQCHQP